MIGTTFEVFNILFSFFIPTRLSLRSYAGFSTQLMNMDFCQSPAKVNKIMTAMAHEGLGDVRWT